MSKVRILTPFVSLKRAEEAEAIKQDRLVAGKIRLGLLENAKPNARLLLGYVGEQLTKDGLVESFSVSDKTDSPGSNPASIGATAALLDRLSRETDVVLTALGN